MTESSTLEANVNWKIQSQELRGQITKLERRDWQLWWIAALVLTLLVVAVVAISIPAFVSERDGFLKFNLNQAVRGLVGLVLLFEVYVLYQQIRIKRLRRQLEDQMEQTAWFEAQAASFQRMAVLDPLTELFNRRMADERLRAEVARSERHGHSLAVILLDLDNFKNINDVYGHSAGDQVLQEFAKRLREAIRASDTACRVGGDEFLIVVPECAANQVHIILERIWPVEVELGNKIVQVTFSAGWTDYRPGDAAETLLARTDEALYMGKRASKRPQIALGAAVA